MVQRFESMIMSISNRSSSTLKSRSSYSFLRMCLKDELSSLPMGTLIHSSLSTDWSRADRDEQDGGGYSPGRRRYEGVHLSHWLKSISERGREKLCISRWTPLAVVWLCMSSRNSLKRSVCLPKQSAASRFSCWRSIEPLPKRSITRMSSFHPSFREPVDSVSRARSKKMRSSKKHEPPIMAEDARAARRFASVDWLVPEELPAWDPRLRGRLLPVWAPAPLPLDACPSCGPPALGRMPRPGRGRAAICRSCSLAVACTWSGRKYVNSMSRSLWSAKSSQTCSRTPSMLVDFWFFW
mmetsp:Transcript_17358/g.50674  ORF Transcript_17358/g.50674 Transcript_17358/m.50674 type:complete len:296 (+) Transcript_17358:2492-3379(+)